MSARMQATLVSQSLQTNALLVPYHRPLPLPSHVIIHNHLAIQRFMSLMAVKEALYEPINNVKSNTSRGLLGCVTV
jgi:hypothetical protein